MPTNNPTGYETYIYSHRQFHTPKGMEPYEDRQYRGPLHDPKSLPAPEHDSDTAPFIMVEPSYASYSNEIWLYFRNTTRSMMLPRLMAEQLRDALIKVCEKPLIPKPEWETPVVPEVV